MQIPFQQLESLHLEPVIRWTYALGTALAATVVTFDLSDTAKATILALAHVFAAALVAYARRPRTVRVRRRVKSTPARVQKPCQRRKK